MLDPLEYLLRPSVLGEMSDFLKGRWVAVHCSRKMKDGRQLLVRYAGGSPLKASSPAELAALLRRLGRLGPRAVYGTANVYAKLETREDALNYSGNVLRRIVTWDIDSLPEHWRATIEAARAIVDYLEREGVVKSVWLKWSGRGMHVHLHEYAVSSEVIEKHGVLDATWSLAQLVLEEVKEKIREVNAKHGSKIKVENLMDPQRVFTAPLSLHRALDVACVALKPEQLDDFEPSWTNPESPVHNPSWRAYEEGEADHLAEKAVGRIGGYLGKPRAQPVAPRAPVPVLENPSGSLAEVRLRFNPYPGPLKGRKLYLDPMKAVRLLEDVLSHYVLGNIGLEEAVRYLEATRTVTLKAQGYSKADLELLEKLYDETVRVLLQKSREEVEEWLRRGGR